MHSTRLRYTVHTKLFNKHAGFLFFHLPIFIPTSLWFIYQSPASDAHVFLSKRHEVWLQRMQIPFFAPKIIKNPLYKRITSVDFCSGMTPSVPHYTQILRTSIFAQGWLHQCPTIHTYYVRRFLLRDDSISAPLYTNITYVDFCSGMTPSVPHYTQILRTSIFAQGWLHQCPTIHTCYVRRFLLGDDSISGRGKYGKNPLQYRTVLFVDDKHALRSLHVLGNFTLFCTVQPAMHGVIFCHCRIVQYYILVYYNFFKIKRQTFKMDIARRLTMTIIRHWVKLRIQRQQQFLRHSCTANCSGYPPNKHRHVGKSVAILHNRAGEENEPTQRLQCALYRIYTQSIGWVSFVNNVKVWNFKFGWKKLNSKQVHRIWSHQTFLDYGTQTLCFSWSSTITFHGFDVGLQMRNHVGPLQKATADALFTRLPRIWFLADRSQYGKQSLAVFSEFFGNFFSFFLEFFWNFSTS